MHFRPALAVLAAVIVAMSASAMVNHAGASPGNGAVHSSGHPGATSSAGPTPSIPAPTKPFVRPGILPVALTVIYPNGTISNSSAPITRDVSANTYTFTASFIGGILDERNGSNLVGAGKLLTIDTSLSFGVEVFQASTVTISGLNLHGTGEGVFIEGVTGVALHSLNITTSYYAVEADYSTGISLAQVNGQYGYGLYGYSVSGFSVSDCNVTGTLEGVYVEYGSNVWVTNTTAYQSSDGVYVEYSNNVVAWGDNVSETTDALYFYEDGNVVAEWNLGFESEYFLYDEYGSGLVALHNTGAYSYEPFDTYYVDNILVDFFNASHCSGDAFYLEYGSNVTLWNINVSFCDGYYTLYTYNLVGLSVTNMDGYAFYEYGAYLEDTSGVSLSHSNFSAGTYTFSEGIYTDDDLQVTITDCAAWDDESAYEDYGSGNLTISGNDFSHTHGNGESVYLEDDANIQILNDNIFNASEYAVETYYTSGLTLTGNNASWSGYYGFYSEYSNNLVMMHNTFDNAAENGLYMYEDTDASVVDNTFGYLHNLYSYAMEYDDCAGLVVEGNAAQHANYSLYLGDSSGVLYENNNDSNSYYGSYLDYNSNVTIVGNQFVSDHNGFYLDGGNSQLLIYHNNFAGDSGWGIYASVETVSWANGYPSGGNYWSNHTGPDTMSGVGQNVAGSDGIVDTPFVINATMSDPYPLTSSWTTHTATFTETGLTSGTLWGVTIGGGTWWSTTSSIVFSETNGANTSYGFTIGHVAGYHPATPSTGSVTADGSSSTVHVTFTAFNYSVTFHSTGLKSGVSWSVAVNGAPLTGSSTDLVTTAVNGTWSYVPKPVSGYALTTAPGNVTINGAAATVTVNFVLINNTTSDNGNGNGNTGTQTTAAGFTDNEVYGLLAALILFLVLAILGFALYARARRPKQPGGATQWTPPPAGPQPPMPPPGGAPPAGGSPPPGAMGGS